MRARVPPSVAGRVEEFSVREGPAGAAEERKKKRRQPGKRDTWSEEGEERAAVGGAKALDLLEEAVPLAGIPYV